MIIIDGEQYNVNLIAFDETADFLDKFAERTEDGILHRQLIGVFLNHRLQFGSPHTTAERAEYQRLWEALIQPVEFHEVTIPVQDGETISFQAYFAGVGRSLRKLRDETVFWKSMTVNFIAQAPTYS